MRTRARRPSWSNESIELNRDDGSAQHGIGHAVSQNFDSPSGAPSFTPGSLLADLEAQLAAASVSSAPLVPIVPNREYPVVIPVDLNWRDHPRWKPLITTPSRTPNQNDPLVPDRSPTPSAWSNCSDIEDGEDASPGSFIHRRRRKEYVHRAPVWTVRGEDDGVLGNGDPFMGGQKTHPIRQSTTLPNLGSSDEYFRCIAAQQQLMGGFQAASLPHIFDQTLEARPVFTTTPNWPLSKDNHEDLPALAGSISLRPRSLSKNADISVLDLNMVSPSGDPSSQESSMACWSSNRNSRESYNSRIDGSDTEPLPKQTEGAVPASIGHGGAHLAANSKIIPGSLVICLCPYTPAREDEFGMGFGDTFTVLKVFDDGWALCAELTELEHSVEQILNQLAETDPPKDIAKPNVLGNETEISASVLGSSNGGPPQTGDSAASYLETITVTTKRTFPVALSPRTKFLPLLAVTLLCNFGRIIRRGSCEFGAVTAPMTLRPGRDLPSGGETTMIGDMKTPVRTASLQFNIKKQTTYVSADRLSTSRGQVGSGLVISGTMKVKPEPPPVCSKGDPLTDPYGKAPARSRSSSDIRHAKSMKATLKRSFGTLRRKFTQAGDAKPNLLRLSEPMVRPTVEPMTEPMGKHMGEPVGKPAAERGPGLRSDISLDPATEGKGQELPRCADAQLALEKGKRQETLERILPARDPTQDKKATGLIPRISFSVLSLPGFSFSGFS